jgi:Mn-containing catalase
MFLHRSEPIHEVRVDSPDPVFAEKLLEQYGGGTGELTAALTYLTQSFHTEDRGIRDLLQDIATEEFGHLEVIALLIEQHTKRASQQAQQRAYDSTLFSLRGPGPHVLDSKGTFWDGRYVNEGGSTVRDLRANIAAEAGALATYEELIRQAPDEGTKAALVHLATREVSHTQMFMKALESMNMLSNPLFGSLQPDETVNVYYNLSTGPGDPVRGPWNSEPAFRYVADPTSHSGANPGATGGQPATSPAAAVQKPK